MLKNKNQEKFYLSFQDWEIIKKKDWGINLKKNFLWK